MLTPDQATGIALDALRLRSRNESIVRTKIAIREALKGKRDEGYTFAPVLHATRSGPFDAFLNDIAMNGCLPARVTAPFRPPEARKPHQSKAIAALVAEIRRRFDYNPETGAITCRIAHANNLPGDPAGNRNNYNTVQIVVFNQRMAGSVVAWLHYHGDMPHGSVRRRKGAESDAIKNLYVLPRSR